MNEPVKPAIVPDEVFAVLRSKTSGFLTQTMRILTMVGLAAAAVAAADLNGLTAILPPEWAKWVLSAGLFAAAIKNGVLFVGDLLDNGKQDGSFKLQTVFLPFLLLGLGIGLTSCAGLQLTEDGCVLAAYKHESSTYYAGPCVGPDGKVNRMRVQWQNDAGDRLRATYQTNKKKGLVIEYLASSGIWVTWDAKSGVLLGGMPPVVKEAIEPTITPAK